MGKKMSAEELKKAREEVYASMAEHDSLDNILKQVRIAVEDTDMSKNDFGKFLAALMGADPRFKNAKEGDVKDFVQETTDALYPENPSAFRVAFERFLAILKKIAYFLADTLRVTGDTWEMTFHAIGTTGRKAFHAAADGIDKVAKRPEEEGDFFDRLTRKYEDARLKRIEERKAKKKKK